MGGRSRWRPPGLEHDPGRGHQGRVIDRHRAVPSGTARQRASSTTPSRATGSTAIFGLWRGIRLVHDCSKSDTDGHGTWVASRIVGDDNGIGTNGIAPDAKIMGYKALATGFGGLTSWIVDAMIRACDKDADVINMSLGGYDDPNDPDFRKENAEDYFLWKDAVNYCRARHDDRRLGRQRARPQPAPDRHPDRARGHAHDRGRRRCFVRPQARASTPPGRRRAREVRQRLPRHVETPARRTRRDHGLGERQHHRADPRAT